jgi:hypothetical protein
MNVVTLDPPPPESWRRAVQPATAAVPVDPESDDEDAHEPAPVAAAEPQQFSELMDRLNLGDHVGAAVGTKAPAGGTGRFSAASSAEPYDPVKATPTEKLKQLTVFRAVHPLYGLFLMDYLGKAEHHEMIQILESLLEMPGSVAKSLRVPWADRLPPGRLTLEVVDPAILTRGIASHEDLYPQADQSDVPPELRKYPIPLAQKMRMLFESEIDHAGGLFVTPVWAVGDLLSHGGDFDEFVRARDLVKQEGVLFKHLLRMILLCDEFKQLTPRDLHPADWQNTLAGISDVLANACRTVDPRSTDQLLEELAAEV